ncbi:hypothetical protein Q7P37_003022 [Cladosporium fusiforme]
MPGELSAGKLLDIMALADDQVHFVQRQLHYHFRDISHLVLCFKAAHRSDFDDIADDGNRTLAKTGATIMELVEKRCFFVGRPESCDIANKRSNWTKNKDLRAAACDNLGFTPFIITSVRQGNEMPSKNIRAATVAAIVAAVFEDLCDQEEPMASALEKITDLIDLLASSELAQPQSIATGSLTSRTTGAATRPILSIEQSAESRGFDRAGSLQIGPRPAQQGSPILDWSEWIDFDRAENIDQHFTLHGSTVASETTSRSRGEMSNSRQPHVSPENSDLRSLLPRSNQQLAAPRLQLTGAQPTIRYIPGPVIPPIGHVLSLDEEITRSFDEPHATQLRHLSNYLGSTQSIVAFKRVVCDLRRRGCGDNLVLKGARSDAEHLQIVKRLRENSAADSLLTMCHTVRLFRADTDDLVLHPGSFVIQTQTSFGRPQRTATGNPLSLSKAAVTDRKIALLYPSLVPGSEEYQAERRYITKLRQSAAKFALFSKTFGFGVLAFLPYADPLGNGYHLNKSASTFKNFYDLE